jgi:hypothetical protein
MKIIKMILLIMIVSLFSSVLHSQVSLGVNVNIPVGSPRYYYLQDIEAYYDIQASMYIFLSGGRWIHARELPPSYGHYDLEHGHRIIIKDYRGNRPYQYINAHRSQFPKGHYDNPDRNYWSPKDHRDHGMKNDGRGERMQKDNHQERKEIQKADKRFNKDNGNKGKEKGNGHENGKGQGKENKR